MRRLMVITGVLVCALLPAAASAADPAVYASPTGSDSAPTCTDTFPCELQHAFAVANPGEIVQLAAGTYTEANGYELAKNITVQGAPGARPLLKSTDALEAALEITNAAVTSATLQHLSFQGPLNWYALYGAVGSGTTVKDVAIDTPGYCASLQVLLVEDSTFRTTQAGAPQCAEFSNGTVRNVTVETTADSKALRLSGVNAENIRVTSGGAGVELASGTVRRLQVTAVLTGVLTVNLSTITDAVINSTTADGMVVGNTATLRNVTAVGADAGLRASGDAFGPPHGNVTGTNVILRGPSAATDFVSGPFVGPCGVPPCEGQGHFTFSNLRTAASAALELGVGIQTGDPLFVSATDLHLQAGSPARNAGTDTGVDSTVDVDGDARVGEGTIDIGGDEYVVPPATPTPTATATATASPTATATATPTATPDTTAPALTAKGKKKGKVAVTLSEDAALKITIAKKTGKKFKRKGTQRASAAAGSSTIAIKLKGKSLKPGTYRLTIIATDDAGNLSAPATATLKVKRKKRG